MASRSSCPNPSENAEIGGFAGLSPHDSLNQPASLDRRGPGCYHHRGSVTTPNPRLAMIPIRYFKRYRMVLDLSRPLPPVPLLPDGLFLAAVGRRFGRRSRPGQILKLSHRN